MRQPLKDFFQNMKEIPQQQTLPLPKSYMKLRKRWPELSLHLKPHRECSKEKTVQTCF